MPPGPWAPAGSPRIWPGTHSRWAVEGQCWGQDTSGQDTEKTESNLLPVGDGHQGAPRNRESTPGEPGLGQAAQGRQRPPSSARSWAGAGYHGSVCGVRCGVAVLPRSGSGAGGLQPAAGERAAVSAADPPAALSVRNGPTPTPRGPQHATGRKGPVTPRGVRGTS